MTDFSSDDDPLRKWQRPVGRDESTPPPASPKPVFGRKVAPFIPADLEPICSNTCRMQNYDRCANFCCLSVHPSKEEPSWPKPNQ